MLVDDIIAAIETARDKVMAEEVRALTKLGLPKNMATATVAKQFHIKADEEESGGSDFDNGSWPELS
jgi:hypothetical protein